MTEKTGLSGGTLGAVAGGVVVVAAVLGWQLWPRTPAPPPAPVSAPVAPVSSAPSAPAAAPPATVTAPVAPVAAPPVAARPAPPRFDTFRLGDDGTAIVAGIGAGGTGVGVLVDGAEVAQAAVDGAGRFAAIFALAPAPQPRTMTLRLKLADGGSVESTESVVIAPVVPPATPADPAAPAVALAEPSAPQTVASTPADPATLPGSETALPTAEAPATRTAAAGPAPAAPGTEPPAAARPAAPAAAPVPPGAAQPPAVAGVPAPQPLAASEPPAVPAAPTPLPQPAAAPAQPSSLLVSEQGVRVLRPASDAALAIDAISYSEEGAVRVSGKGGAGAFIRLYLNNAPQLDTLADETGAWHGTLPPVTPGLYTLRADQIDAGGKVAARSETPFLREPPEALAAAGVLAPGGAAAQVVTVQPGYTLWGIARQRYGRGIEYVKVFEANRSQIRNPHLIYPGQVFSLPGSE